MSDYSLLLFHKLPIAATPSAIRNITSLATGWKRSIRARGGYWLGNFFLDGEDVSTEELIWWFNNYLGNFIKEMTFGLISWEGLIYEMELSLNGIKYRRTLDYEWFHNKVKVLYQDEAVASEIAWAEDTDSSDIYGEMNYIDVIGEATSAGATALRDTRLEEFAWPRSRLTGGLDLGEAWTERGENSLMVTVAGYVFTLNWRFRESSIEATGASTAISTLVAASEFVTAGTIDSNTMSIDADCTTPQRLWDLIEDIILQGDASNNRWVGGVYNDRKLDYNAAATEVTYWLRNGVLTDKLGAVVNAVPTLLKPDFIVRDANAPSGGTPIGGNIWDDYRNQWIEEVEFIAPDQLVLKPVGFDDVEVLKEKS